MSVSPGQRAIEKSIALATSHMTAATWQQEAAIALAVYAAVRADPAHSEQRLDPTVAVIRDQYAAAKQGSDDARYAILDACDELRTTAAAILPHTWMPATGTTARPPGALLDATL